MPSEFAVLNSRGFARRAVFSDATLKRQTIWYTEREAEAFAIHLQRLDFYELYVIVEISFGGLEK